MRLERVAAAPISWGVCEVPGWGVQLGSDRVLTEITALGLRATERGPVGFLPSDPKEARAVLASHDLALAGAFLPVVMHDPAVADEALARIDRSARELRAAGGSVLVLAASTGGDDYDRRWALDDEAWRVLADTLERVRAIGERIGVTITLHPHVGTVVERPDEVARILVETTVPLCLDTGHLLVGGGDPVELAATEGARIAHVHLKDVDARLARRVRDGNLPYRDAVAGGMYRPLGSGDAEVADVVRALEGAGYEGWYVLEQDLVLDDEPERGGGPVRDVEACVRFIEALESATVGR